MSQKISGLKAIKVFHLAMCPLFLGMLLLGFVDFLKGKESKAWPTVPGIILSAESQNSFLPLNLSVKYSYSTGEGSFVSNKIWTSPLTNYWPLLRKTKSDKIIGELKQNPMRKIYVNPNDNNDSVLFPGNRVNVRWWIVFVGVIALTFLPSAIFDSVRYNPFSSLKRFFLKLNS